MMLLLVQCLFKCVLNTIYWRKLSIVLLFSVDNNNFPHRVWYTSYADDTFDIMSSSEDKFSTFFKLSVTLPHRTNRHACKREVLACIYGTPNLILNFTFPHTCWYFCSFETPAMYKTYLPKQSCRNDIFSAREPNICSLNKFFTGHKFRRVFLKINHANLDFLT